MYRMPHPLTTESPQLSMTWQLLVNKDRGQFDEQGLLTELWHWQNGLEQFRHWLHLLL